MSSFVALPNPTRISAQLRPAPSEGVRVVMLNSKFGVTFAPIAGECPELEIISGKNAGERATSVGPNQRAVLTLGIISPSKYQALIVTHPDFGLVANVQHALMVEPKETCVVRIVINAYKEVDLKEFPWYARVYLFE